nr:glutaredoxin [Tanacetum cinerariifolium]
MWSSKQLSEEDIQMALSNVKQIVSANPAVVFSKTYCGYCKRVKQLFSELNVAYKLLELDEESNGDEIQSALKEWTGQSTVPNVFIAGKHIGGCDVVITPYVYSRFLVLTFDIAMSLFILVKPAHYA